MSDPVRSCVICRKKDAKRSLQRFVWKGGKPERDILQVMLGRGAYCCLNQNCEAKFLLHEKKWRKIFRK